MIVVLLALFSILGHAQNTVRHIGDALQVGVPISSLGVSILKGDNEGAIQLVKSFALQTGSTLLLKRAINRKRPNGGNYSFPSGHTSLAFVGSTYYWKRYGWKYGLPATALAGFVGYSRLHGDSPKHHVSDVFAGAALGVLSGLIFTKRRQVQSVEIIGNMSFVGCRFSRTL